jgi:tetratricopeptide (TPR) repeat protein
MQRPDDPELAARIGRALVAAHDYERAIAYYTEAARQTPTSTLQIDLARVLFRVGRHDRATQVLEAAVAQRQGKGDLRALIDTVTLLRLLADVLEAANAPEQRWLQTLSNAHDIMNTVLRTAKEEQPDVAREQRVVAAALCIDLAKRYEKARQPERAIAHYNEALSHDELNAEVRAGAGGPRSCLTASSSPPPIAGDAGAGPAALESQQL